MGLLILLIVLGVFNMTMQNYFCKNLFNTRSDNFAFSIIFYSVAVITTFLTGGCKIGELSPFLFADSLLYGLMLTLELYCTLQAYKYGSMSLTSMFIMASIMIPAVPSWIFWGDPVTWQQIAGMAVMFTAIALILNVGADVTKEEVNWKWFIYCFIAFLGSGLAGVSEKILTESAYAAQSHDFVLTGLIIAVISMAVVLCVLRRREPVTIKFNARVIATTAVTGVSHSFICIITMLILAVLPASVVYTINNGARLILITVIDVILFKEKLIRRQYIGLALGVVGVVLLSL